MALRNFTDSEEEQIAKIYLAGHSARSISRAYGLSHHISILNALRRQKVIQRSPSERNRIYSLNPHAFDQIGDEEVAYWWGFLYADGHVRKRSLIIAVKYDDRNHLEKLKEFMGSTSPILERYRPNICHNARIEFTDEHLAHRLKALGIIVKRTNPMKALQNLPTCLNSHWIRGYFDGDGSARKNPSLAFCGSKKLLMWIRGVLANDAGTNPELAITKHSKGNIFYLYIGGRLQALKVTDYMYSDATIWMSRKRDIVDSWPIPKKRRRDKKGRFI